MTFRSRPMRRRSIPLLLIALACAPRTSKPDAPAPGDYRFLTLNGQPVPAEYPPGSGAMLEAGSLRLTADGRFALRFTARLRSDTASQSSGPEGRYRVGRDTVYFTPEGREGRPPLWFRFVASGTSLDLTDGGGNIWGYQRAR